MSSYVAEDEDVFLEDEPEDIEDVAIEDIDEAYLGEDEDLAERRRRFSGRRPQRVRAGRTPQGRGYAPRGIAAATAPGRYVTEAALAAKLEAVSARIGRDVRGLSDNIKRVAAQINTTNSQLAAANKRQDGELEKHAKQLKKLGETDRRSADSSMMLALLPMLIKPKPPTIAANPTAQPITIPSDGGTITPAQVAGSLTLAAPAEDKLTTILPLFLIMGMGGSGGSESQSGGMSNMMLPLLAMTLSD
ncbi:MAG: hypothetical protein L0Y44_08950 [Phycisphaerales bacterium]|nr:hypothetical protein [Phycisphaerales bacterium]